MTLALLVIFNLIGYFVLALWRPRSAVIIMLIFLGLWPPYAVIFHTEGIPGIMPARLMLIILIITWMLHIFIEKKMRDRVFNFWQEYKTLVALILGFYVMTLVSSVFASDEKLRSVFAAVNQIIMFPFIMLLVISYFSSKENIYHLTVILVFIALATEIIGVMEWFYQHNLFESFVSPASEIVQAIMKGKEREGVYRIQSTFSNALSYCEYLIFMFPIGIYLLRYGKNMIIRVIALLQLILSYVCIIMTQSRTGLSLSLFMVLILLVFSLHKKKLFSMRLTTIVLISVVTVILISLYVSKIDIHGFLEIALFGTSEETFISSYGRLQQLMLGTTVFLESPAYGHGVLQGINKLQEITGSTMTSIDNYYLTVMLEVGIIGLALLIMIQAKVLKLCYMIYKGTCDQIMANYGFYLSVSFMGLFAFQLTLSYIEAFSFSFAAIGMLINIRRSVKVNKPIFGKVTL